MSSYAVPILLVSLSLAAFAFVSFVIYLAVVYTPIIGRIFEEKPLFLPLRVRPEPDGEAVTFPSSGGLTLQGTYLKARTAPRAGVVVFCHEYLSDRWSYRPYADGLRDLGFDLFTFDFRNHGASASDPIYQPLQWVTDHETADLRAALNYLRARPDHDRAGYGLFGISRGGSTALVVAADDPGVWGVITDGAFPTRGTMFAYILRWARIYIVNPFLWRLVPRWLLKLLGAITLLRSQARLHCRFPNVETAVRRLAPRPWLMIHGEKDAYIGPDIALRLFDEARSPKDAWIVPGAKHNRCRELQADAYAERIRAFFQRYAPRRLPQPEGAALETRAPKLAPEENRRVADVPVASALPEGLIAPVTG